MEWHLIMRTQPVWNALNSSVVPFEDKYGPLCPPGSNIQMDMHGHDARCGQCPANTYKLTFSSLCRECPESLCSSCPEGGICPGGNKQLVAKDFWIDRSEYQDQLLFHPYPCLEDHCCTSSGGCAPLDNTTRCQSNRAGLLCMGCVAEAANWFGTCETCDGVVGWVVVLYFVGGLLYTGLMFFQAVMQDRKWETHWDKREQTDWNRSITDFIQMASLVLYTSSMSEADQSTISKVVFFDATPIVALIVEAKCPFYITSLTTPLVQLAMIVILVFFTLLGALVLKLLKRLSPNLGRRLLLLEAFVLTPQLLRVALEYLDCRTIAGHFVMASQPTVKCGTTSHIILTLVLASIAGALVFGVPACMFVMMRSLLSKHNSLKEGVLTEVKASKRRIGSVMKARNNKSLFIGQRHSVVLMGDFGLSESDDNLSLSQLYFGYRPSVQMWYEAYFWCRRSLMMIISVFANDYTDKGLSMRVSLSVYFSILLIVHIKLKPYIRPQDNLAETLSLICLLTVSLISTGNTMRKSVTWDFFLYLFFALPILLVSRSGILAIGAIARKKLCSKGQVHPSPREEGEFERVGGAGERIIDEKSPSRPEELQGITEEKGTKEENHPGEEKWGQESPNKPNIRAEEESGRRKSWG